MGQSWRGSLIKWNENYLESLLDPAGGERACCTRNSFEVSRNLCKAIPVNG